MYASFTYDSRYIYIYTLHRSEGCIKICIWGPASWQVRTVSFGEGTPSKTNIYTVAVENGRFELKMYTSCWTGGFSIAMLVYHFGGPPRVINGDI